MVDSLPDHDGTKQTMLAALSLDRRDAPWDVDGAVKGAAICRCWVSEVLCPILQPGDLVLWDNLAVHTVAGVEELLATRSAQFLRLSPSSPDVNPIAPCWSKITMRLRRAKVRTVEALIAAIKEAIETVTAADSRGRFVPCGYPVH